LDGDYKKASKMQLEALPLIDSLFSEVNPIPVKKALNLMGFEVGPLRKPLTEMEDGHTNILKENMKTYGIY
jgi:4-hydroxy-tetrahydrodipicolinate synthase